MFDLGRFGEYGYSRKMIWMGGGQYQEAKSGKISLSDDRYVVDGIVMNVTCVYDFSTATTEIHFNPKK
jgi:hypothetical protein